MPSLLQVGAELVADGVPLTAVLEASAEIQEVSRRLSSVFVRLYLTSAWEPFVAAGMPDVGWTQLTEAMQRQRAIWPRAVLPALAHALDQEVEAVARGVAVGEVASTPT